MKSINKLISLEFLGGLKWIRLKIYLMVMYIENEGFYYSDEDPKLFDILPFKKDKITRNDNEPSYFMMVKEGRRKGTLDEYIKYSDNGEIHLILVDRHPENFGLHDQDVNTINRLIDDAKRTDEFKELTQLIRNGDLIRLYNLQRQRYQVKDELSVLHEKIDNIDSEISDIMSRANEMGG